jgi:pimeloyl-ACP methyl ester carboxylesterase
MATAPGNETRGPLASTPTMTLRSHLGGSIFAEHVSGQAPTVLALHGWGRDRGDLLPTLSGRDVIALDLPGFGSSPPPDAGWGSRDYADAVAKLLDELEVEALVAVGHSFGGRVATCLAARHPHLVSGVVLVGTPLLRRTGSRKSPAVYRAVRRLRRWGLVSERTLDGYRQRYGSADYRAADETMRPILVRVVNEDYAEELAAIDCPVALVWGAGDTAAPASVAREAGDILGTHLVCLDVVEGASHDVHLQQPDRITAAVDAVIPAR